MFSPCMMDLCMAYILGSPTCTSLSLFVRALLTRLFDREFDFSSCFLYHNGTDFDHRFFWQWTDFRSYVEFIAAFTLAASILTYVFVGHVLYVELLGFTSLLIEAMLGVPQFYDNFVSKSTFGMRYMDLFGPSIITSGINNRFCCFFDSRTMVLLWLAGDTFKTLYFLSRHSPIQFSVCGALQIAVDLAILSQTVFYGATPGRRKGSHVVQ